MNKFESAYKTIGEVVEIIGLKSKRGDTPPTHTIRYWEKEFKQIKPKILNNVDTLKLDGNLNKSIKTYDIKSKLVKISNIIRNLKD